MTPHERRAAEHLADERGGRPEEWVGTLLHAQWAVHFAWQDFLVALKWQALRLLVRFRKLAGIS